MKLAAPKNSNYAATVVELKSFVDVPKADRIKSALIFGNSVIVSKDAQAGDVGLFFPAETQLDAEFLSNNNLYRKAEYGNKDPEATGFFEQHGRVKTVKFLGTKSEGFFISITALSYLDEGSGVMVSIPVGTTFDAIDGHTICRKYVIPSQSRSGGGKVKHLADDIVPGQFDFHYDSSNLRRNAHKITPDLIISVSDKWHGTSVVISKPLIKRSLKWYEKLLKQVGVNVSASVYGTVYSSRKVIKAVGNKANTRDSTFYTDDIWGIVAREVEDRIPNGYAVYGEIVGYTPNGTQIQKGYHYGCQVGSHKLVVYRVTNTNVDGLRLDLGWLQMIAFCEKFGFETVKPLLYGRAGDLVYAGSESNEHWGQVFVSSLEAKYVNDGLCPYNNNEVPAEGVVVRIDGFNESEAFKLKNFRFLERETKQLDKGEADIESEQTEEAA